MKKVIYKFSIDSRTIPQLLTQQADEPFTIEMPKGAQIMAVQPQMEINEQQLLQTTGKIWALCDPEETEKEERVFKLIMTGQPFEVPADRRQLYCGTYQVNNGRTVAHLFEIIK